MGCIQSAGTQGSETRTNGFRIVVVTERRVRTRLPRSRRGIAGIQEQRLTVVLGCSGVIMRNFGVLRVGQQWEHGVQILSAVLSVRDASIGRADAACEIKSLARNLLLTRSQRLFSRGDLC